MRSAHFLGFEGAVVGGELGSPGHGLKLTQNAFAELLGISLATMIKWERVTGEPSGAAKTLLAVARINPEVIKESVAVGK